MAGETESQDKAEQSRTGFSLWGLGSSVLDNVTQNAATFVNTIIETDWQKEINDIHEGLRNETAELGYEVERSMGVDASGDAKSTSENAPEHGAATTISDFGRRFFNGTAEILNQVRSKVDSEFQSLEQEASSKKSRSSLPRTREGGAKFSRLDMKISAMQRNSATYCDEPEDKEGFSVFVSEYNTDARSSQAESILSTNPFMSELHSRLVPLVISDEIFWQRYFFRLQKLTQEYEKVQERLQQAHRRAEENESEPLDSLDATCTRTGVAQADASPAGAWPETGSCPSDQEEPSSAPGEDQREQPNQSTSSETEVAGPVIPSDTVGLNPTEKQTSEQDAPSMSEPATTSGVESSVTNATEEEKAEAVCEDPVSTHELPKPTPEAHVSPSRGNPEAASAPENEPEGETDAGGSSQSSGNGKLSEWSVVSKTQDAEGSNTPGVPSQPGTACGIHQEDTVQKKHELAADTSDTKLQNGSDASQHSGDDSSEGEGDDDVDENWGQWE